jgi:hypothetical protein
MDGLVWCTSSSEISTQDPQLLAYWALRDSSKVASQRVIEQGVAEVQPAAEDEPVTRGLILATKARALSLRGRHAESAAIAEELRPLAASTPSLWRSITAIDSLNLKALDASRQRGEPDANGSQTREQYAAKAVASLRELARTQPFALHNIDLDPDFWAVLDEPAARAVLP